MYEKCRIAANAMRHGFYTLTSHSYAGITRIRFEGPGRRYVRISAGMRQRPLELSNLIITRRKRSVKLFFACLRPFDEL